MLSSLFLCRYDNKYLCSKIYLRSFVLEMKYNLEIN